MVILTNIRYPPRKLVKEIRDELVIRESIDPKTFRTMIENKTLMENRDLILKSTEIDVKEGVNWRYEEIKTLGSGIVEYHLEINTKYDCLTVEITDKIRLVGWKLARYDVLAVYDTIGDPLLTLLSGTTGAIRRYLLSVQGCWLESNNLANKLEMVRDMKGQLIINRNALDGFVYEFYPNQIIVLDGINELLKDGYNSPALKDLEIFKRQIILQENEKNKGRVEEINILAGDNKEYRDALIAQVILGKDRFVQELKEKIRQLKEDQEKLNKKNRYYLMGKYHSNKSYIDNEITVKILRMIRSLGILSQLSQKHVYILYDLSKAIYYQEEVKFNYTHVSPAEQMIDQFREKILDEFPKIKQVYITDSMREKNKIRVDGEERDITQYFL